MSPVLARKLKLLGLMCAFTSGVGVLYELVDEKTVTASSILFGLPMGLTFAVMELFVFNRFRKRLEPLPFVPLVLVKATLYTLVVWPRAVALGLGVGLATGKSWEEFVPSIVVREMIVLLAFVLAVYAGMVFFLEINRMLGHDALMRFIRGKYRRPTQEDRIFMFLDLKASTTIAERLGSRYYLLLNDFFHDISLPVMMTRAEIYQYVGDEVVLTWQLDAGLRDANCLRTYSLIQDAVAGRADEYMRRYGMVPEYKAGLHCGVVVSAQIGDIKREIVYNGDVVNTASRIQEQCGELGEDLVISDDLMRLVELPDDFTAEPLGHIELKGKEQPVELWALRVGQIA
jgi:adenylate cyclase